MKNFIVIISIIFCSFSISAQILPGAYQTNDYLPALQNKKVAVVANQSSLINNTHLVDSLLNLHIEITKVFAPEHGFRGKAEAGAKVEDGKDAKTGLSIVSLYGKNKKPRADQLKGVDIVIFDLQGVGARFYTYISTMKYVMEACGEQNIPVIILDRPNPNIHYVDGPVLKEGFESFVGSMPIPIVYGMSDGELAQMINGEKWNDFNCELQIVPIKNYYRKSTYELPVKPSPNLPNFKSIYLYPSLCLFEGTPLSIGRGTDFPFQVIGFPENKTGDFAFKPRSIPGVSAHPKFENQQCFGVNFANTYANINEKPEQLQLFYLITYYQSYQKKDQYFTAFFDKLAGTDELRKQIEEGLSEKQIKNSWKKELDEFKAKRAKYLIYE